MREYKEEILSEESQFLMEKYSIFKNNTAEYKNMQNLVKWEIREAEQRWIAKKYKEIAGRIMTNGLFKRK